MAERLPSTALLEVQPLERWCRRCQHCLQHRSSGSGQTKDWVGIVLISAGVYLSSGGPLPRVKERESHHHKDAENEDEQSRSVGEIDITIRRSDNAETVMCP